MFSSYLSMGQLRSVFISEEEIGDGERTELRSFFKEIAAGKGKNTL